LPLPTPLTIPSSAHFITLLSLVSVNLTVLEIPLVLNSHLSRVFTTREQNSALVIGFWKLSSKAEL
jgi:hypothetical protein